MHSRAAVVEVMALRSQGLGASTVDAALALAEAGANATDVARQLRIPRTTVRDWLAGAVPLRRSLTTDS